MRYFGAKLLISFKNLSYLKGSSDAKLIYMLFKLKYVLAVCVHNHTIKIEIQWPRGFFYFFESP